MTVACTVRSRARSRLPVPDPAFPILLPARRLERVVGAGSESVESRTLEMESLEGARVGV